MKIPQNTSQSELHQSKQFFLSGCLILKLTEASTSRTVVLIGGKVDSIGICLKPHLRWTILYSICICSIILMFDYFINLRKSLWTLGYPFYKSPREIILNTNQAVIHGQSSFYRPVRESLQENGIGNLEIMSIQNFQFACCWKYDCIHEQTCNQLCFIINVSKE